MAGPRLVFVLGAGFTRAFMPSAPLLRDRYDTHSLMQAFKGFPHATRILELELGRNPNGEIDIERLMTRLDGRMPYDFQQGSDEELGLLFSHVKRAFVQRLADAKRAKEIHSAELAAFARHCVDDGITCITFNYDDVFDQALFEVAGITGYGPTQQRYWHPDGGYGFFCKPSETVVQTSQAYMDKTSMLLLKLHGSINWRLKLGDARPYSIDAIVHHEPWLVGRELAQPIIPGSELGEEVIPLHLEPEPFIVPPVLVKSALVEQPILRAVWSLAYQALSRADQVVFVGYSMPSTDLAASFLFSETLEKLPPGHLKVVNKTSNDEAKKAVQASYRNVFPKLADDRFEFRDALEWASEVGTAER